MKTFSLGFSNGAACNKTNTIYSKALEIEQKHQEKL